MPTLSRLVRIGRRCRQRRWRHLWAVASVLSFLSVSGARASEPVDVPWPQFRGPTMDGQVDRESIPTRWSKTENVAWVIEVPGRGWSSPVVAGGRVFVTAAKNSSGFKEPSTGIFGNDDIRRLIEEGKSPQEAGQIIHDRDNETPEESGEVSRHLYCFDVESGSLLWEREVHRGPPPGGRHRKNTYASETPVVDAERVYAYFGNVGVWAFGHDGRELWSRPFEAKKIYLDFGTASSPAIDEQHLYVVNDNDEESYLAALDKSTGEVAWKVVRSDGTGMASAWASPYLWRYTREGVTQTEIVAPGAKRALGYSTQGELLWSFDGFSQVPTPTPFAADGVLFLSSGSPSEAVRPLLAVRAGARGDISLAEGERSNESVAWYQPKGGTYIPSPVLWQDRLFVIYDKGIMAAFDAESGEELWKARIGGGGHTFSSSPWAYDGKIFALSEEGRTFVLEAGDQYRELHSNDLDELTLATPAAAYDSLFLRTERHLYRLTAQR